MTFKTGEVVVLKSGGPAMTVAHVDSESVLCIWIEKNKTFREPFPPIILEKFEPFSGALG